MWNAASIAEILHDMKHYGFQGYDSDAISFDWSYVKENRDKYLKRLNKIYERNLNSSQVESIVGTATLLPTNNNNHDNNHSKDSLFTNPDKKGTSARPSSSSPSQPNSCMVLVTPNDKSSTNATAAIYSAKHILIATGGYPTMPDGPGIRQHAITSDGFFDLDHLPSKAVVVGGGYIAVELAGVLQALGTDTSLVLRKDRPLRNFDEMISDMLDSEMQKQGIHVHRNTGGLASIEEQPLQDENEGEEEKRTNPQQQQQQQQQQRIIMKGNDRTVDVGMTLHPDGRFEVMIYDPLDPEHVGKRKKRRYREEDEWRRQGQGRGQGEERHMLLDVVVENGVSPLDGIQSREQLYLTIGCIFAFLVYFAVKVLFHSPVDNSENPIGDSIFEQL
mmetsp:Transcript_5039/g.7277  ORF Transcript_5039/g.7277 Transcript_5039/m.7277 type:complete len:389 (+) Transcript_5039:204-1370(+)